MRKDERNVIGEETAISKNENVGPDGRKDEPGVDRRNDETGVDRRKDEAGADRRKDEAKVEKRKDEAGIDRRKDKAGAKRRKDEAGAEKRKDEPGAERVDERKSVEDGDELVNTPYDDVYRTMINDASELILPVLNEIFGEHYDGTEKIVFTKDTHILNRQDGRGKRRTTDSSFAVIGRMTNYYLMELQSWPDSSLLIPFYIFSHEKSFPEYEADGEKLELLKKEYVTIMNRLETLEQEGQINAYNRSLIMEMSGVVLRHIAAKYDRVKSEVRRVMGGRVLEYEAKKIREEERKKSEEQLKKSEERRIGGIVESVRSMMKELQLSADRSMTILKVSEEDWELVKSLV